MSNSNWRGIERVELALEIMEYCEVMEEFEDSLWIKIDKELWNQFQGVSEGDDND
jgi:hypothetical protein